LILHLPPRSILIPYTTLFRSLKILPISNFNNGKFHNELTAFAMRLFPQPGIPVISKPFGAGNPYASAEPNQERSRFISQFLILRSEEHTSELQSRFDLVCRLL